MLSQGRSKAALLASVLLFCGWVQAQADRVQIKLESGHDTNVFELQEQPQSQPYLRIYLKTTDQLYQNKGWRTTAHLQYGWTRWPKQATAITRGQLAVHALLPMGLKFATQLEARHRSLLQYSGEQEPVEPGYLSTVVYLRLEKPYQKWVFQTAYRQWRIDYGLETLYDAADTRYQWQVRHQLYPQFRWQFTWNHHQTTYEQEQDTLPSASSSSTVRQNETFDEWRFDLQIYRVGLWTPFYAYEEQRFRGSDYVSTAHRLGLMAAVPLSSTLTVQIYGFLRKTDPERSIVLVNGSEQDELFPERQLRSIIISLVKEITESSSIECRWRWYRDQNSESRAYIKHVFSLAYRVHLP